MGLINLSLIGRFHRTAGYVTSRLTNQRVIKMKSNPFVYTFNYHEISCKIETSKSMFYELAYWPALRHWSLSSNGWLRDVTVNQPESD